MKIRDEIVAIIPARVGSKGLPKKNIIPLKGKPLIVYTIESAWQSNVVKDVFVTTDSKEIAEIAHAHKAKVINRPADISHDTASTEAALIHAVKVIEQEHHWKPAYIMTLQPTSPLRTKETIKRFINYYMTVADQYDALFTMTENRSDFWLKKEGNEFQRLFPDAPRRRQDRTPLYSENSAIYLTRVDSLLETKFILGKHAAGFVIEDREAVDIHSQFDLQWAEFCLSQKRAEK